MKRGSTGIVCWLCLAALACDGTDSQLSTAPRPTLIRLDPETFLGGVQCSPDLDGGEAGAAGAPNNANQAGASGASNDANEGGAAGARNDANSTEKALKTYVATLVDKGIAPAGGGGGTGGSASESEEPKQVSSPIASCLQGVVFGQPATAAAENQVLIPGHNYEARIEGYTRSAQELRQRTPGAPELVDATTGDPVQPEWTWECEPVVALNRDTNSVVSCAPTE